MFLDLLAQAGDFAAARIAFAQFALNGANLFAQEKIALTFGHRRSDFLLNFGTERKHFQLAFQQREQAGQSILDVVHFEQLLPFCQD